MQTRSRSRTAIGCPLLALHNDLLQLIAIEIPSGADVKALSRTCHALHGMLLSGGMELAAAWAWKQLGNMALVLAMRKENVAMLRQLVEVHAADVNCVVGEGGLTLLQLACNDGELEAVEFLLTVAGLQVNAAHPSSGFTALHRACQKGHVAVVRELLKHPSINVNAVDAAPLSQIALRSAAGDNYGLTALHYACQEAHDAVALELLKHPSVNVNAVACSVPVLSLAAMRNREAVARALLSHPGFVALPPEDALSAIVLAWALAERDGHMEMMALLAARMKAIVQALG